MHMSVQKLVEFYAKLDDANVVNEYHIRILGVLILDIFGYVYNHFKLLSMLGEYDIDKRDLKLINGFLTFMSGFIVAIVDCF